MGKCFSSCLPQSRNFCNMLSSPNNNEFNFLVEESTIQEQRQNKRSVFARFFKKREGRKKPALELVDGVLNPQYSRLSESQQLPSSGSCTSKDFQLQRLDARALLTRTNTPTPDNSLDLEWEHENLPISMTNDPSGSSWAVLPEDFAHFPTTSKSVGEPNSDSDWSRVSSVNSLEWDNVPNSIQSDIDTDTQFLLSEIDRLTNKALQETGFI